VGIEYKCVFENYDLIAWTGFNWFRKLSSGEM